MNLSINIFLNTNFSYYKKSSINYQRWKRESISWLQSLVILQRQSFVYKENNK